jgi:hypothetical protein
VYQYGCDSFVVSGCAPLSYLYYKQPKVAGRPADVKDHLVDSVKCSEKNVLFRLTAQGAISFITAMRTQEVGAEQSFMLLCLSGLNSVRGQFERLRSEAAVWL